MLKLNSSTKFRRDLKLCAKRHYNMELLEEAVNTLRIPAPLPPKNKDHALTGNHASERECHLTPDWLLIYRINGDEIYLVRTGTHSDLFDL
jgi:mRNA interferase YafQ